MQVGVGFKGDYLIEVREDSVPVGHSAPGYIALVLTFLTHSNIHFST